MVYKKIDRLIQNNEKNNEQRQASVIATITVISAVARVPATVKMRAYCMYRP